MDKTLSKSFLWMFVGLIVTFVTGFIVSTNPNMVEAVLNSALLIVLLIVELALVIFFTARIKKMHPTTAKICFLLYSFVSGLTFSTIFLTFEIGSIIYIFLVAAIVFALFGLFGYFTKIDLSRIGIILLMLLLAIIIMSIINIFIGNDTFNLVINIIGLVVFFIYTAYDIQKIKNFAFLDIETENLAIYGAFQLYLDFINIFLRLLEIFGKNKES